MKSLTIDDIPKESISNLDVFSADEYPDYNISISSSEVNYPSMAN